MSAFDARDLIAFPGGDNSSDTVIGGIHFNLTSLEHWNYTLYSNGTLSNGSNCFLTFAPYTPALIFSNGTLINATSCYSPIKTIGARAGIGVGFAVAFGLALILTLVNLGKHGKRYLPAEKRFYPIGRRWQWYWAAFVSATAFISLITNVDVDRYYLPELPIVLNVFFWYLMQEGAMACVWEAVRHWGSWMERQYIDPNPFELRMDDKRAKFEFWIPLFYYLFLWMNFFLIVPRSWSNIELQRYPEQTLTSAEPTATDGRFKAGAFCLAVCWLIIIVSLRHSISHYCPRNRGVFNRIFGLFRYTPFRFLLMIPLAGCMVAYQIIASFSFANSPLKVSTNLTAMYAGGYAPALLIILINAFWGFIAPNEDRELLRQRRVRGQQIDNELGFARKPAWWRRVNGELPATNMRDRITRNVRELGGGSATGRNIDERAEAIVAEDEREARRTRDDVELGSLRGADSASSSIRGVDTYAGKSDRRRTERTMQVAAGVLFPDGGATRQAAEARRAEYQMDGPPSYSEAQRGRTGARESGPHGRNNSTGTTNSVTGPPQQIKSMLDI